MVASTEEDPGDSDEPDDSDEPKSVSTSSENKEDQLDPLDWLLSAGDAVDDVADVNFVIKDWRMLASEVSSDPAVGSLVALVAAAADAVAGSGVHVYKEPSELVTAVTTVVIGAPNPRVTRVKNTEMWVQCMLVEVV